MARTIRGTAYADILRGLDDPTHDFDDIIYGYGGNDTLTGGEGDDRIYGNSGRDTLIGGVLGRATSGLDWLFGGSENDLLYGLWSETRLYGGTDNDTYYIDGDDWVIEYSGQGTDTVQAFMSADFYRYTLTSHVENLTVVRNADGPALSVFAYGNGLSNEIRGSDADFDFLYGRGGNDRLLGRDGDDLLYGGDGVDFLDGGEGADVMEGGADDDSYVVDNTGDRVVESVGGGRDIVFTSLRTTTTPNNVETLVLTAGAVTGYGNASSNNLVGNTAANVLAGRGGADRLTGGGGNDWLVADQGQDTLNGGQGDDFFVFEGYERYGGQDEIEDFQGPGAAGGDRIVLLFDADPFEPGYQRFTFVGTDYDGPNRRGLVELREAPSEQTWVIASGGGGTYLWFYIDDGAEVAAADYTADDFWIV